MASARLESGMRMAARYCKKDKPGLEARKINAVFKLVVWERPVVKVWAVKLPWQTGGARPKPGVLC